MSGRGVQCFAGVPRDLNGRPLAPCQVHSLHIQLITRQGDETSSPKMFNDSGSAPNISSSSGAPNLASIITDFAVGIDGSNQYRPNMLFSIQSECRSIDMYSMVNLNRTSQNIGNHPMAILFLYISIQDAAF